MPTLEQFIVEYFGTIELAARRMHITRWTLYRWLDNPERGKFKYYQRLCEITNSNINDVINYGGRKKYNKRAGR
jgi:hypothetical protein